MANKKNGAREWTKTILGCVVFGGTGVILGNAVRAICPGGSTIVRKAMVGFTTVVLGGMLGDKAQSYVEGEVDEVFDSLQASSEEPDEAPAE